MTIITFIQNLYRKYKSNIRFNTSLILSEFMAPVGSVALAFTCDYFGLGNYVSSIAGGIAGHYVSAVVTFGIAWYFLNRQNYREKFKEYLKDWGGMIFRNLIPAGVSYIIYMPIAGLSTFLGAEPAESALYASVLSAVIFMAGSNIINKEVIRKYN